MVIAGWVQTFTAKETVYFTNISSDPPVTKQKSNLSSFSTPALQHHADFKEESRRYRKRGRAAWIIVEDIFTVSHFKVKFKPLKGAAPRSSPNRRLRKTASGQDQPGDSWWNSQFVRKQNNYSVVWPSLESLLFYLAFFFFFDYKQSRSQMVLWLMSEL